MRSQTLTFGFKPTLTTLIRRPITPSRCVRIRNRPIRPCVPRCAISSTPKSSSSTLTDPHPASPNAHPVSVPTFQEAIQRLQQYWSNKGCIVWHPYNSEVGAGTMNPATYLRVLGPEPWSVAYNEPSIRPDDSRYGTNPNRLQQHTQFQVIMKPTPDCAQELVIGSYRALGIDTTAHDFRFVEDNWESPVLGAWGLGWEVWLDGMEVTQFTYFQQAGGLVLDSVAVEITYGLERIVMQLQQKNHFKDIVYAPGITYGDVFMQNEVEMSKYNLDEADIDRSKDLFKMYEAEALELLKKRLPVPAYNFILKSSHTFNILDARGAVGVTERARFFQRMRMLSRDVANLWVESRAELGFPLAKSSEDPDVTASTFAPHAVVDKPKADLVFEIGVEELPPNDVVDMIAQVEKLLPEILQDARLGYSGVEVNGTPRRVSAFVKDLQTRQDDESKRIRGPPLKVALKDGQPTRAATGFLKSQGADESSVEYNEEDGYMYATVETVGQSASEVLADALPNALLKKIGFKKSMRWNDSGLTFSRPIRWILCLLDTQLVPFEYAGVHTSTTTRSLRTEGGFAVDVPIPSAEDYHDVLVREQILLSQAERRNHIRTMSTNLTSEVGGMVPEAYLAGPLMDEIVDLVESPIPLLGRFDEEFLALPDEVLIYVMQKHQRYLPVVDQASGALLNAFVAVANGNQRKVDIDAIRQGNEAVIRARYSDAAFFYQKDTDGKKLADFVPQLHGLTFQEKLGSMADKIGRIEAATPELAKILGLNMEETERACQAASLSKADLGTMMVVEMTSLAGVIGRHYAEKSGEVDKGVAQAIFEATLPRFSGDELPQSKAGITVALADRLDSLVSLFSVGLAPKATADPFALRRAALGVVQSLISARISVNLTKLISVAEKAIVDGVGLPPVSGNSEAVLEFIAKRLEGFLLESPSMRPDVVKAVLAISENACNPYAAAQLTTVLQTAIDEEVDMLTTACETHGRAARLLRSLKGVDIPSLEADQVDEGLFEEEAEAALWRAISAGNEQVSADPGLECRLKVLAGMNSQVENFFDGVFVNAEDEKIRKNRLSLSAKIAAFTGGCIDLAELQL